jgi:preprotein translocase subunit SecY/protein transport protein SEC61 subunit alpha
VAGRFLGMFKPLSRFMPEVGAPQRGVRFNEKLFWTGIALVIYLVMCEVPLYGVGLAGGPALSPLRVIFASTSGSLMELGIGPIVTAGLIIQLLAGSGMIEFDQSNPDDRGLFTTASKVLSIIMTGVQASAYLIGGFYGSVATGNAIIIFMELMGAGIIIILLDEMIQKGWGIGSGISLFIVAGVAKTIVWDSLATWGPMSDGKYFGAIVMFVQTILARQPLGTGFVARIATSTGLVDDTLPTMLGFVATIAVFLIVIYCEGVRLELPVSYADYRGFRGRYPIKLLYVSNLPVIFAAALFANIYFIAQFLWTKYNPTNSNFWLNILGQYTTTKVNNSTTTTPTGGLAYYVTSPNSIPGVMADPLRAFIYAGIMVLFCVVFSLTWLEVGGLDSGTVAKQLVDSGMHIPGFRRSQKPIEQVLKRYIPVVTVIGGVIVGVIAAVANFFGVFGSGMGVLLSVGILYQYYQLLMQERIVEMYPAMRRFLGE